MTLPVNPKAKKKKTCNMDTGYAESNRKTQAFYVTLAFIIILFISNKWIGLDPNTVISNIVQLASIYIGGLAVADSVRYHKFGSNTLGNPEKAKKEAELKERYEDK